MTDRRRDVEGERALERESVCTCWWEGDRQAAQVGHIPAELGNCKESLGTYLGRWPTYRTYHNGRPRSLGM